MFRTPLVIAAGLATAILTPALAYGDIVVVDGNHFGAADISILSQSCTDPASAPATAPALKIVKGPKHPKRGTHSIGWDPSGVGFGTGPMALLDAPAQLERLAVTVYSPNSYATYVPVVSWVQPDRAGVWKGIGTVAEDHKLGWHTVSYQTLEKLYTWRHYDANGVMDEEEGDPMSLANFVHDRGSSNEGAKVGMLFGCDGDPVYYDAMKVVTETTKRTYDFEGFQTNLAVTGDKAIRSGQRTTLHVHLAMQSGKAAVNGPVKIEQKSAGSGGFQKVATRSTKNGAFTLSVKPSRTTTYRATYAGSDANSGSTDTITVTVKR